MARLEGRAEGHEEGRAEGREQGRAEGRDQGRKQEIIKTVHFCQRLLNRPESPPAELAALSLDELSRLADELQAQALKR